MTDPLQWLSERGATFALPRGKTKSEFERNWQNTPHALIAATEHANRGNNIGILCGKYSSNIVALDRDIEFPETITMLNDLAKTVKIVRDNAPERGKFLYRVTDRLPSSRAWKRLPTDKHPAAEMLSTGKHALVPPSEWDDGYYKLVDESFGILEITHETLNRIWWLITSEHLDKVATSQNEPKANKGTQKYVERVKDSWTTQRVFEHFQRATSGAVEGRGGQIRLLGNGGLLLNDWRWYCHADSIGGDVVDAWSYCRWGRVVDRKDPTSFWDTINDMASAAGIEQPKNKSKKSTQPHKDSADSVDSDDSEESTNGKPKQADELFKLASSKATFFKGRQDGMLYAAVEVDNHRECYRLKSERFNDWLSFLYYEEFGTTVNAQARTDAKNLMSFVAQKNIEDVFVRVGHKDGKVYLDLCSVEGDAIEVDETGWRVVPVPPVHFRRSDAMLPLPIPIDCRDPLLLRRYLNIVDDEWALVAAWIVAALHPRGPYPALAFLSRAGSGKSTALRVLKRIIDPSSAELRSLGGDVRDLFIAAANCWLLCFDNVSQLSNEISDALCVIATGGGYTKRANYTDGDEAVINVQRPVAINGIGDIIARQDLMDRSIIIKTPFIPETDRKEEAEFWESFEENKPKILGAFLYALSTGIRRINQVVLDKKPRMADFARLAVAAEPSYTDTHIDFQASYTENRNQAADTIVENSPVGEALVKVLGNANRITESPQELYTKICAEAGEVGKRTKGFPDHHNQLKETLERLAPALDRLGIRVDTRRANGKRLFDVWKHTNETHC